MRGSYFVLEGIDGNGKSTQAQLLYKRLKREKYETILTSEPSKLCTGHLIRKLIDEKDKTLSPEKEAFRDSLVWFADRVWNNFKRVKSALEEGKYVISSRNYLSTIAYQGSLGVDLDSLLYNKNYLMSLGVITKPDLNIIIDIPIEEYERRVMERERKLEKFEKIESQRKIRKMYLEMPNILPNENIVFLNGEKDMNSLHEDVYAEISPFLRR
jgi:dTMP kinase